MSRRTRWRARNTVETRTFVPRLFIDPGTIPDLMDSGEWQISGTVLHSGGTMASVVDNMLVLLILHQPHVIKHSPKAQKTSMPTRNLDAAPGECAPILAGAYAPSTRLAQIVTMLRPPPAAEAFSSYNAATSRKYLSRTAGRRHDISNYLLRGRANL